MKNQQIHKYAALISKYQNKKKSSRLTASLQRNFQTSSFSQSIDPGFFKHVIQQKIKNKYRQPKSTKTSTQPSTNYLHLETIEKISQQTNKDEQGFAEENQKMKLIKQKDVPTLKVNNLRINKKNTTIFINTSNLLFSASPTFIKNRRQLQDSKVDSSGKLQKQVKIFKHDQAQRKLKQDFEKEQKFQKIHRYGYQLDGSIFHFQNSNIKTLPSYPQCRKKNTLKSQKKQKQRIYEALKSTTPLVITQKMLKNSFDRTQIFANKQLLTTPHKFLRKKMYIKSSSERIQNRYKYNQFKVNSLHVRQSPKVFKSKKQEVISGWDYDQQF